MSAELDLPDLGPTEAELDETDRLLRLHMDEDTAMAVLEELVANDFVIVHKAWIERMLLATLEQVTLMPLDARMKAMGMERWCPFEQTGDPSFCECELYVKADEAIA